MTGKIVSVIAHIRTWPEEDRKRAVYVVAGTISLFFVVLWFILLPFTLSVPRTEHDQKLQKAASALPGIGQFFGEQLSGVKNAAIGSLSEFAQKPDESSTTQKPPVNEAGVTPIEFPQTSPLTKPASH